MVAMMTGGAAFVTVVMAMMGPLVGRGVSGLWTSFERRGSLRSDCQSQRREQAYRPQNSLHDTSPGYAVLRNIGPQPERKVA